MTSSNRSQHEELPRIVLIGMRGSGKTSVGRELAQRLGVTPIDSDDLICKSAGATIAEIFARDGEAGFRAMEQAAIARALAGPARVISVGGGAILDPDNRARLRNAGCVVWLRAPAEVLFARIAADAATSNTRPALTPTGGIAELRTLLTQRDPAYRSTAHAVVDTADLSLAGVVDEVISAAGRWAVANRT